MVTDDLALRRARKQRRSSGAEGPQRFEIPGAPPAAELRRYQVAWIERAISLLDLYAARAGAEVGRPEDVAAEVRRAATALAGLRATLEPPIDRYCDRMGLDARDRDALALIASPHLDPTVRDQVTRLRGAARGRMDVGFVAATLAESRSEILELAGRLGRQGALAACGLVEHAAPRQAQPVSELDYEMMPTARLFGLLQGEVRLNVAVGDGARLLPSGLGAADGVLDGGAGHPDVDFAALVCGQAGESQRGCVLVAGPRGAGKLGVAAALAARAGYAFVLAVEHALLPRPAAELGTRVEELSREARQVGALLAIERVRCDAAGVDAVRLALRRASGPTLLTADSLEEGDLNALAAARVEVRRPNTELRRAAWRAELALAGVAVADLDVLRLAADIPIARPAIATAVAIARSDGSPDALARAARAQVCSQLARYAEPSRTHARLADLILADDGTEQVAEVIAAFRNRPRAQERWGGRLTLANAFIVLLNGPPGTGKSLAAGAIAHELDLPLYRIDVSRIFDRYVGETEKNLARLFEEAAADRAALLFDEADSLFARRVDVKDASDRHANTQVNVLLERIERHEGLVLLTTNLKSGMDEALLRRITFKMEFRRPDPIEREALWKAHVPLAARAADLDLHELAKEFRTSGADIRNAVTRAILAAGDGAIDQALLRRSIQREIAAAGGVVRG